MTGKNPLVSICLPNLNTRPYLDERMETILNQTVPDWELIICDSYSDDGAWEFFQKFKGDPRIRMYQVPREGVYAGWNECLRRATGQYIYMATSDDTASTSLLEEMLAPLERRPELHIAVCGFEEIDEQSRPLPKNLPPPLIRETMKDRYIRSGPAEFLIHLSLGMVWITMAAVLFRRKLLEATGYFRTDQWSFADANWVLRAVLQSDVAIVPKTLATWRRHPLQLTSTVVTRKSWRAALGGTRDILNDSQAGIPESWKQIPHWKNRIRRVQQIRYLEWLDLYRWVARSHPRKFFQRFVAALRDDPPTAAKCILRGFGLGAEADVDYDDATLALLREFGAEWPPKRLWG